MDPRPPRNTWERGSSCRSTRHRFTPSYNLGHGGHFSCSSEKHDPAAIKDVERKARRERLQALLEIDTQPLPEGTYSRWDRVCLRRLRTGTAMVPKRTAQYENSKRKGASRASGSSRAECTDTADNTEAGLCKHCKVDATEAHIFWVFALYR